ncbi:MAG: hypothetical protein ACO3C1_00310 [Ilumatobacteraceae bacterium]
MSEMSWLRQPVGTEIVRETVVGAAVAGAAVVGVVRAVVTGTGTVVVVLVVVVVVVELDVVEGVVDAGADEVGAVLAATALVSVPGEHALSTAAVLNAAPRRRPRMRHGRTSEWLTLRP